MRNLLLLVLIWLTFHISGQTIKVVDIITRQSVPGVVVHTSDLKIVTTSNTKGEIEASQFKNSDTLFFSHVSYGKITLTYVQLEANEFNVELKENNFSLNEVVIAANRWEESKSESPFRVDKMNMKEMAFQNPQTAADLLGAGGSVYIQKSQQAGGSPMLRGFATNRVMLVVDGVRMNNAIFRSGNVQNVISLDANGMDEAEVLFGPGAVMYGSDAIGGVMDFHTKNAILADSNKTLITENALGRFSTANKENTIHFDFNVGFKKIAFITSYTHSDYDDLMAGKVGGDSAYLRPFYQMTRADKDTQLVNSNPSLQVNSKYDQVNLMQKILFAPTENLKIDYAFHFSQSGNAPRYDRLITDVDGNRTLDFSEWYYGSQQWKMHRLGIHHKGNYKLYNNFRVVAAYQHFEESRHDRRFNASGSKTSGNARLRHQFEKLDAFSINIDLDKKLDQKTILFYGAESVFNVIRSNSYRQNIYTGNEEILNPRYPNNSTWQTMGVYTNLKHKINNEMIVNAGIRYTYYSIVARFDTLLFKYPMTQAIISNGALNGSIGFVYSPIKNWQMYLNVSTGFRAPNIDDIGKVFDSQPGIVVVPNSTLKPEYAYSGELGSAAIIKNFLKLDGAVYYTYLSNALVRRTYKLDGKDSIYYNGTLSQVNAIQNANHALVYGIQNGVEIYFGHGISLRNNISWQIGKEYNLDSLKYYPLTHSAPFFGSTHLAYTRKKVKVDFYLNYNGKMNYENLALSERAEPYVYARSTDGKPFVPSWYTLNFKMAFYVNKYLAINAGVENITDRLYRPYSSGISAPGRNFIVSLRSKI